MAKTRLRGFKQKKHDLIEKIPIGGRAFLQYLKTAGFFLKNVWAAG
jgi:hypothetical protein